MTAVVYTDASYCHKSDVGACGFIVILNGKMIKHEVELVSGLKTPTNAEIHAIVSGIQYAFLIKNVRSITVNTDCKTTVVNRKGRKQYKELNETIQIIKEARIGFSIFYVRGHSENRFNNIIDQSCNASLRKYLKEQTV